MDNRRYQIFDTKRGDQLAVGALFYLHEKNEVSQFYPCNNGTTDICSGQLPDKFRGMTCMKALAGNGNDPNKGYHEGEYFCFDAGPRSEGSPG